MPDAIEQLRGEAEADLEKLLRGLNRKARGAVLAAVGRYGSVEAIPLEFWEALKRETDQDAAAIMLLLLAGVYGVQNRRLTRMLPAEAKDAAKGLRDEEALRRSAAGTAAKLGRDVADGYVEAARKRLERTLDATATKTAQRRAVDDVFDDESVGVTSTTQTTRGVTAGQDSAADDIGRATGIKFRAYWVTFPGACEICRPLNGMASDQWEEITRANTRITAKTRDFVLGHVGQGPPAHAHCRCKKRYVVMIDPRTREAQ